MNANEAKSILLIYRPGTADVDDPQIAEALALAKRDPQLAAWLAAHNECQTAMAKKFRQIAAPVGLKEQIISEQAASERPISRRQKIRLALAVIILLGGVLAIFCFPRRPADDSLTIFQNQMVGVALRGYAMDLMTNDPAAIRSYLAQNHAPADFILPAPLAHVTLAGCAVEDWQGVKVAMICFRTGKPLAPGAASDLWLFVVDRAAVRNAPNFAAAHFSKVNRLMTGTWIQGDKLYLLGIVGQESNLKSYL